MTKPLREAESNGVRVRWNPENQTFLAQVWNDADLYWRAATDDEKIDHAAVFAALREQPYAPEPVDPVVEAIHTAFKEWLDGIERSVNMQNMKELTDGIPTTLAATIRPLVLASTPTDDLVGELVKRGNVSEHTVDGGEHITITAFSHETGSRVLVLPLELTR